MPSECDILVVGAGPAGSSAAAAARHGLRVVVVERRKRIGVPVRCAEYIPRQLLWQLDLDRSFVVQPIRGMRTVLPSGRVKETIAPGLMINRDRFDQALARMAMLAGAEIKSGTRVIGRKKGCVFLKGPHGDIYQVKPRVIIGADGPFSTVGRWIGLVNRHLISAVQVKVALVRPMEFTEVYFHPEIYGGYAWLFPKGKIANVGLGICQGAKLSGLLKKTLAELLNRLESEGKTKGPPVGFTAGWIPAEPVRDGSRENIILAGDAAGQAHPITGAGVSQAVLCGRMAGKWAARAVLEDNLDILKEYDKEWQDDFGDMLNRGIRKRKKLEEGWDRLEDVLPSCWVGFKEYYERS